MVYPTTLGWGKRPTDRSINTELRNSKWHSWAKHVSDGAMNYRSELVDILSRSFVFTLGGQIVPQSFASQGEDIALSDLVIDSLSAVQVCVELENRFGWSIAPNEFLEFTSLGMVAVELEKFAHG